MFRDTFFQKFILLNVWVLRNTCYRCSEKPLYWAGECRLQEMWYPPHTDTDRYTESETHPSPLGLLGLPSETETENESNTGMTERQAGREEWTYLFSLKHSAVGGERRAVLLSEFTGVLKRHGAQPHIPVHPFTHTCTDRIHPFIHSYLNPIDGKERKLREGTTHAFLRFAVCIQLKNCMTHCIVLKA